MYNTKCLFPILVFGLLYLLVQCKPAARYPVNKEQEWVMEGSNTELPIIQELVRSFTAKNTVRDQIHVKGGGTNDGLEKLLSGSIDVANASRLMTESEYLQAVQNGFDAVQVIIAMDALAFITHPRLGVDSLNLVQLKGILTGATTNWKEVGGPDLEIQLYSRTHHSGTYSYVQQKILGGKKIQAHVFLDDPEKIRAAVEDDLGGIGYMGVGSLVNEKGAPKGNVWAMNLYIDGGNAYSPFENRAVKNGDYPLARPLLQYYKTIPEGVLLDWIQFVLSEEGQQVVEQAGYFPINDYQRQINQENGILF